MRTHFSIIITTILLLSVGTLSGVYADGEVGQWKRYEVSFENTSWEGNPYDVKLQGVFTSPSGRKLKQWGFYAGDDTWKIYFMPDETGEWTFETTSSDTDLEGVTDSFTCIESDVPGQLVPAENRWKLEGRGGDLPVLWNAVTSNEMRWDFRGRKADDPLVREAIRFAGETVGARLLGFDALLVVPTGWAADWPQESVPFLQGEEGEQFNHAFWDELNAKLDAAREKGMGAYIMLFSDDELTPDNFGLTPRSKLERRFLRYVVARLSPYPHILWDSGIDISEYRSQEWSDWFCRWMKENDPWQHPVGSRSGGGSGGSLPEEATYFSTGGADLPTRSELLEFLERHVPVAHTDHWRPFHTGDRGGWTHRKIRVVHWRCALSGAQALYPDYNQGDTRYDQVQMGGRYIGYVTSFFRDDLKSDLLDLDPHDEYIQSGENAILAANPGREYVVYDEDGGTVHLDLTDTDGSLQMAWYNPRTGRFTDARTIDGGRARSFTSPTAASDWVLHIYRSTGSFD